MNPYKSSYPPGKLLIGILDDHRNTDIIIVLDPMMKKLTWIPRDVFSYRINHRINAAFSHGGHRCFIDAVKRLGFDKISHSVCIPMDTCKKVFSGIELYVDIPKEIEYYYPIKLFEPIENGHKIIRFEPPGESLKGERIHQFLGARIQVDPSKHTLFGDFERIERQQVFFKSLIREGFNFQNFCSHELYVFGNNLMKFFDTLDPTYRTERFDVGLYPSRINKMLVLKSDAIRPSLLDIAWGISRSFVRRYRKHLRPLYTTSK